MMFTFKLEKVNGWWRAYLANMQIATATNKNVIQRKCRDYAKEQMKLNHSRDGMTSELTYTVTV